MEPSMIPPLVSINEACRLLGGRGRGRVYELLKAGEIDSVVDRKRRLILGDSLIRYIARLSERSKTGTDSSHD
jgi:hypothetical protein